MKHLTIVRHAKSSWENPEQTDFKRILNLRGMRDAKFMGELIAKKISKPDLFLSSPAFRAVSTAKYFADAFGTEHSEINTIDGIYDKGSKFIIKLICSQDDNIDSIILFGHNPDMTSLTSYFSGEYLDNLPTCGVAHIVFDIKSWKEIENNNGKLDFFESPKKYFKKD